MQNVVLVTIDSLRADHVGYHGYERDTTPNLDELAAGGSRFMNAFAHVGGTRFSFPSILSGVTPLMHGGHERISDSQTLVSEVFDDAGYRTGGFHSNLYVSGEFGYDRGWDEFYDSAPNESVTASARRWAKTNLKDTPIYSLLQRGYDFLESSQGVNVGSYHVRAEEITDRALEFVRQKPDEPTFLWVHYMDVHHPFLPDPEYQRQFRDDIVGDRDSIQLRRKFIEEPEAVTDEELQTFIDLYDAEIAYNDEEVGRLVDELRTIWDDPLIAFTADHGDHFLEHGYFGGARTLDVKTHVPLAISGWGDNGEYDELVGLVDVPSTLLDTAELPIPETYQGHSLRSLVFDGKWPRTSIIGGWDNQDDDRTIAIRERNWKLVRRPDGSRELYELDGTGIEDENVVGEYSDVVHRLEAKLDDHLREVEGTMDDTVERPDVGEDVKDRLRRLGYDE
jgi:arylsulfatase A-like enzyme